MDSYSRSVALTGALLLAAAVSILVGATPQVPDTGQTPGLVERGQPPRIGTPAGEVARGSTGDAAISLSDPDGQELIIEDLDVRVAIHGMLSLTEIEFRFRNPQPKRMEGRFTCTLPPNAAISRFAKEVGGQLMEGEVVERLRANQVYEQYLHQMRDPALLEQDQGNRFSARIFPIEANDTVRILLSYSMLIPVRDGVRTYSLPLRGIPEVGHFAFRASVNPISGEVARATGLSQTSVDVFSMEERDYRPAEDLELRVEPAAAAGSGRLLQAGDFYLAALRPEVNVTNAAVPREWTFYIDTSASAAEGSEHRIQAIEAFLAAMPSSDQVEIFAFDNGVVSMGRGSASSLSSSIAARVRERLFLGGTDLVAAMRHAAQGASAKPGRGVIFVSDLVPTLGQTSANEVLEAARALPPRTRVDALILGSRQDAAVARRLTAGRGRVMTVPFTNRLETNARDAAALLRRPLGGSIEIRDAASEWVYPSSFDDVQPGDEVIVLGRTRAGAQPQISAAGVSSMQTTSLRASTFGPLLEREAYRAYLDYLSEREAAEPSEAIRRALASEQVRISIEQRVVIPRTTMLVLENEWEYQRWGLDRRALAAILTVDASGISRLDRQIPQTRVTVGKGVAQMPPPPAAVPVPELQRSRPEVKEEGAVSRGMVGGVINGVVGGIVANDAAAISEAVTVTASAPSIVSRRMQMPAIMPAPPPPPREPKRRDDGWIWQEKPKRDEIGSMQAELRNDPKNRTLYNKLSDALVMYEDWRTLRELGVQWQPYDPENPQVYEILGLAAEHLDRRAEAERAYASLIEVAPAKPELLQRAGLLLVRVGGARLAETPLRKALELRPDRVNSHRHLALMLWLDDRPEEAARVLEAALQQNFPNWYGDVRRVVREELGYVYRSWGAKSPDRRAAIEDRARDLGIDLSRRDALRVTLAWETDANDVDLHVVDPDGEECFYGHARNRGGLELYQDITQGFGPEVIRAGEVERGTYHVGVRYFAAGPMGVSRGLVVVMRSRDGREPTIEIVPFRLVEGGGDIRYVAKVEVK
ncbi:MAG TPA: VIT domain-containing protein [Thermoanaerobaculia bacterium]|nr:VIT domain-containing protein [Thermoanaerobaculia bacterium]